jgi:peptide/nickel transport system permease protein
MAGFIVRRLITAIVVVALTSMIVFVLLFQGLGTAPARQACDKATNGKCTPEKEQAFVHQMGLDKSVTTNYKEWVVGLFKGREVDMGGAQVYQCDAPCLGISITTNNQVWDDLKQKYPATITLAVGGATIYLLLGVILGSIAARFRGSSTDRLMMASTLVVSSIPYYLVALMAWIYLSLQLKIFPDTAYHPWTENPAKTISAMMLPWLVIGLTNSTQYARFSRGQMVETVNEDYIRTAQSKGVKSNKVIFKHALRAAIVPVITIFGLDFATLLAGTIFTERIFGIDGVGNWTINALQTPLDYSVITAGVLVSAVLVVVANLIVDILYSFLDPRVSVA